MSHTAPTHGGLNVQHLGRNILLAVAAIVAAVAVALAVSDGNEPAPATTTITEFDIPAIIDGVPLEDRVPGEDDLANPGLG